MAIIRTNLAMSVTCKCGCTVAATMLYGSVEIDADFMDTVAKIANNGGKVEILNTDEKTIKLSQCKCEATTLNQ